MQSLSVAVEPTSPNSLSLSEVLAEEAELHLWDMDKEEFDLQGEVIAQIAQPYRRAVRVLAGGI